MHHTRNTVISALSGALLMGGLLVAPPTTSVDTVTIASCTVSGRSAAHEIRLECGASSIGFRGAVAGAAPAVPSGRWAKGSYGTPGADLPIRRPTQSLATTEQRVRKLGVPWPSRTAKRAQDMSDYRVYTIYGINRRTGEARTYKFGITKVGDKRPRSQIRTCERAFGSDFSCRRRWVRENVDGWTKARRLEAIHAARYKDWAGRCPPGMKRCL